MRQNLIGDIGLGTAQTSVFLVNGTPSRECAHPPL